LERMVLRRGNRLLRIYRRQRQMQDKGKTVLPGRGDGCFAGCQLLLIADITVGGGTWRLHVLTPAIRYVKLQAIKSPRHVGAVYQEFSLRFPAS
jgi:hypothetical protein